jgi:hypothetical protein
MCCRYGRNEKYIQNIDGKPKEKRQFETITHREEDGITVDRKVTGCEDVDWSPQAEDMASRSVAGLLHRW